jgi:alanine-synthesizing transaminase
VRQARRLESVRYDLRGEVLHTARALEADGQPVIKLNLGNPGEYGLAPPDWLVGAVQDSVRSSSTYTDSRGLLMAREAVAERYSKQGLASAHPDRVFLGNGVSELILMTIQALVDPGDEVLIPAPDYPLWTAALRLCGGTAVHYRCVEEDGWAPDLDQIEELVTSRTKAVVLINPNNPTGAVYPRETVKSLADLARRRGLVLLSDEIYDEITFNDSAQFVSAATLADEGLAITFGGLSKVWRAAGYRGGWMMLSEGLARQGNFVEGLDLLANLRLCPNTMAQHGVAAAASRFGASTDLVSAGGLLRRRRDLVVDALGEIDGVDCVTPDGALYAFPRIDPGLFDVDGDQDLVLSLLRQERLLLSHGSGFNLTDDPHLRIVYLADEDVLADSCSRLARHLTRLRKDHS